MTDFKEYLKAIDDNSQEAIKLANDLWDNPELCFGEYKSSELIMEALQKHGFKITKGLANIPTAFKAEYGSGSPSIGVLAEFDALPDLNFEAGKTEPVRRSDAKNGHGCGHNLFAGGSFAAAVALKEYVEKVGKGKITLFGCPGEENGGGKVYMVRDHVFDGVDAIVSWHPEKMHMVRTRPSLANIKVNYSFKGTPAHAGGSPQLGRSALDAVELMSVGVNYLREHMDPTSRIHYAYLDAGGEAPNIVQSKAKVTYMIRACEGSDVKELFNRVTKVAQGAAMMTETEVSYEIIGAYSNLITIPTLQQTGWEVMQQIPAPVPTQEDLEFGEALRKTMNLTKEQKNSTVYAEKALTPAPPKAHGGSTDTSDVSWNVPTVQFHIGTWAVGTPGHSWQAVSQGKSRFAHEAMLYAARILTGTAIRLYTEPELLEKAKQEHFEKTGGEYISPLPEGLMPKIRPRED